VKGEWSEAKAVLGVAFNVVYDVVLLDLACSEDREEQLKAGLERLAAFFAAGSDRKMTALAS
jgi:hypothetical protein